MPPLLALTLSLGFSGVLLFREAYQQKDVSRAVWIPCIWLLILGSRPISAWIGYQGVAGMDAMMEGSPVDRLVYLFLMIAALGVVVYRRLKWREIFVNNRLLICFIVYVPSASCGPTIRSSHSNGGSRVLAIRSWR